MRFTDKTLGDNQSYTADFEATNTSEPSKHTLLTFKLQAPQTQGNMHWAARNSKTSKCTLLILRHRYCSECRTAELGTCGSGRGMDSGELAQNLCLRASPCLSLCRCLNLLHSPNLHDINN